MRLGRIVVVLTSDYKNLDNTPLGVRSDQALSCMQIFFSSGVTSHKPRLVVKPIRDQALACSAECVLRDVEMPAAKRRQVGSNGKAAVRGQMLFASDRRKIRLEYSLIMSPIGCELRSRGPVVL